jgi:hypothetical protein
VRNVDATVKPLTATERGFVAEQLRAVPAFLADYGSGRHPAGLDALDHAWASWLDRQQVDPVDPNPVINLVGVSLGQALIDALAGFDWVVAEDEGGTDLAVFGLPGAGDVLFYPANLVAKRYQSRTAWFLQDTFAGMVDQVNGLRH